MNAADEAAGQTAPIQVRAAGCVVWRPGPAGPEVALIHRPRYDDWSFPKGKLDPGEGYVQAAVREVREETGLEIEPLALAGYREVIARDANGRVERHFVILPFAARWRAGEITLNEELAKARWLVPAELSDLATTEGLAEIVGTAWEKVNARS